MLAANFRIPAKGSYVLISIATGRLRDMLLESVQMLAAMGYKLCGTPGTAEFYRERFVLPLCWHFVVNLLGPSDGKWRALC